MGWIHIVYTVLAFVGVAGLGVPQAGDSDRSLPSAGLIEAGLNPAVARDIQSDLSRKDYPEAEVKMIRQIEKMARPRVLLETLGDVFFLDSNYLEAAIAYKKAESYGPLSEDARFTMAMSYIELKRGSWARNELLFLTKEKPGQALYRYWLGRLDYDDQKFADGIANFNRAIDADGSFVRAYDGRGLCEEAIGTLDSAEQSYKRANALNREQASRYASPALDYGTMLAKFRRYREATTLLKEALTIDPSLAKAHYELGRVDEQSSRIEAAAKNLKEAARLDPNDPSPVYALFRLYTKMGKKELAAAMMVRFRQLKAHSSSGQ